MQTIERPPEFRHDRRRFLGVAALSLAAMQLGPIGPAKAQGSPAKPARPAAISMSASCAAPRNFAASGLLTRSARWPLPSTGKARRPNARNVLGIRILVRRFALF